MYNPYVLLFIPAMQIQVVIILKPNRALENCNLLVIFILEATYLHLFQKTYF